MKLRKLNGAIRALQGNPLIAFRVGSPPVVLNVHVQKTDLLAKLGEAFPDGGETGLCLTGEGFLTADVAETQW